MDGRMDGQTDGWMDGWMEPNTSSQVLDGWSNTREVASLSRSSQDPAGGQAAAAPRNSPGEGRQMAASKPALSPSPLGLSVKGRPSPWLWGPGGTDSSRRSLG